MVPGFFGVTPSSSNRSGVLPAQVQCSVLLHHVGRGGRVAGDAGRADRVAAGERAVERLARRPEQLVEVTDGDAGVAGRVAGRARAAELHAGRRGARGVAHLAGAAGRIADNRRRRHALAVLAGQDAAAQLSAHTGTAPLMSQVWQGPQAGSQVTGGGGSHCPRCTRRCRRRARCRSARRRRCRRPQVPAGWSRGRGAPGEFPALHVALSAQRATQAGSVSEVSRSARTRPCRRRARTPASSSAPCSRSTT